MSRPRSDNPSSEARRKRFERARGRVGLLKVTLHVHRFVIGKLIARGQLPEEPTRAEIDTALSNLLDDVGDMLADELL